MSILLIGSKGSMGRRYSSILKFLGREFEGVDKESSIDEIKKKASQSTGIIIATPTDTHESIIVQLASLSKPILCEKPVIKGSEDKFNKLVACLREYKTPFRMMLQYEMLSDPISTGPSLYDFYNTGKDGIYWDCIQIIGLARSHVTIRNHSPVWTCKLNGKTVSLNHMDAAYIAYVQKWFKEPNQDLSLLSDIHEKARSLENKSL